MTTNTRNNRQAAPPRRKFGTLALLLTCALIVTGGFFFAAQQHFSSMDYGMKNSRLRRQVDQLEAEKRRLMLAREISLSPTEIKKAVKKIGVGEPRRETMSATAASFEPTRSARGTAAGNDKSLVAKTVSVKPVQAPSNAFARTAKAERVDKKGLDAE